MLKKIALPILTVLFFIGCSEPQSSNQSSDVETIEKDSTEMVETESAAREEKRVGKIILFVKLKSTLTEEELVSRAQERAPEFRKFEGLVQKYYFKTGAEGEFGGVYIWDSPESLQSYKESELASTIAEAYEAIEPPVVEKLDILFQLRE